MKKEQLEAFAREAAKTIKTESDLNDFRRMLTKVTVETALNAELDDHLGYDRHQSSDAVNSRNGYTSKQLKTEAAAVGASKKTNKGSSNNTNINSDKNQATTTAKSAATATANVGCLPLSVKEIKAMKPTEMKVHLDARQLSTQGNKKELLARLLTMASTVPN